MIIDASGLYYRTLYTVTGYGGAKGEKLLDNKKSQGIFMRKLATDFSSIVRSFDEPCRVIVCLDSRSWRKEVEIEEQAYKGNREKPEESNVNWNAFYELTQGFSNILSQKGYLVSKVPGAEADDLLFMWSRRLNRMGENVLMVSGDRDMYQVLGCVEGAWTVMLHPNVEQRKISLTQDTLDFREELREEADIFNSETWSSSSDLLQKIIGAYNLNIVDVRKTQLQKVILGDGGDNVPSAVSWPNKKDPTKKPSNITENNLEKIIAAHPLIAESNWRELAAGNFAEEISSVMRSLKKIEVDVEKTRRNLARNAKLVILDEDVIPEEIQTQFLEIHQDVPDLKPAVTRDAILAGTEWWSSDKGSFVPKSFDLFGE